MSTTNKSEIIRAPRINETAPDFAAAHAAPETGAGVTTLDPSIATPRRRSMPDRKLDVAFWNYDRTRCWPTEPSRSKASMLPSTAPGSCPRSSRP